MKRKIEKGLPNVSEIAANFGDPTIIIPQFNFTSQMLDLNQRWDVGDTMNHPGGPGHYMSISHNKSQPRLDPYSTDLYFYSSPTGFNGGIDKMNFYMFTFSLLEAYYIFTEDLKIHFSIHDKVADEELQYLKFRIVFKYLNNDGVLKEYATDLLNWSGTGLLEDFTVSSNELGMNRVFSAYLQFNVIGVDSMWRLSTFLDLISSKIFITSTNTIMGINQKIFS